MNRISFYVSYRWLLLAPLFLAASWGCETLVDPEGLPFVEHLVVRGILEAGKPLDSLRITRTRPLDEKDVQGSEVITDANAVIEWDGGSATLRHIGGGYYSAVIPINTGVRYRLRVEWQGKRATAETTVPPAPVITGAELVQGEYAYVFDADTIHETLPVAIVRPVPNSVYGMDFSLVQLFQNGSSQTSSESYMGSKSVVRPADSTADGRLRVRTSEYGSSYFRPKDGRYRDSLTLHVYAFDYPYYEYSRSLNNSFDNDLPFASGGLNPKWNVEGDGIGMFIGRARKDTVPVVQ